MKQSKRDAELYLCYQCGERKTKSDLRVEQKIIPKRENKILQFEDDALKNIDDDSGRIIVEPDFNISSYSLLEQKAGLFNSFVSNKDVNQEIAKINIREQFQKMLNNKNVKIDFAH